MMIETLADRLARARRPAPRRARQDAGAPARHARGRRAAPQVPFTTGILVGIGETRAERIDALARDRATRTRGTATCRR